jgi:hypothetical protein
MNGWVSGLGSALAVVITVTAGITLAPAASADTKDSLTAAVMAVRSASCGPLQLDPQIEQVAEDLNRMEDAWLNQDGQAVPSDDVLPLLKDLGSPASKARLLRGTNRTGADAIKGLLLQGYLDIANCSYTSYGVSVIRNRTTNYFLAALVLAA